MLATVRFSAAVASFRPVRRHIWRAFRTVKQFLHFCFRNFWTSSARDKSDAQCGEGMGTEWVCRMPMRMMRALARG